MFFLKKRDCKWADSAGLREPFPEDPCSLSKVPFVKEYQGVSAFLNHTFRSLKNAKKNDPVQTEMLQRTRSLFVVDFSCPVAPTSGNSNSRTLRKIGVSVKV